MSKRVEFKAETRQLLDIVIHSLYSNKEIFLRELVSNASDALDKRRFLSLTDKSLTEEHLRIRIVPNTEAKTLTISDNGIGMNEQELIDNIGTIARSGTKAFMEIAKQAEKSPEFIGQFGVGFYSAFMVADKVTVITRRAGTEEAFRWECESGDSYTIEPTTRDQPGTDVILHLNEPDKEAEDKDFLQEWVLRSLVKRYSDFVIYPIEMDVKKEEGKDEDKKTVIETEILNSMKSLWDRPRTEITADDYNQFYKQLTYDFKDPLETIHFSAEGTIEYKALIYIPSVRPMDIMYKDGKRGIHLYVRKIFIMSECEKLIPDYFRFLKGVVDSSDLSLNVSRELLQQDRQITAMRKRITRKVFDTLSDMLKNNRDKYLEFWKQFGDILKEAPAMSYGENTEDIKDLLLFRTSKSEDLCTLAEVVERMPSEQKDIYYLIGESPTTLKNSPLLEAFTEKGYEVLLLTDRVDEFMMQGLSEYKEKKFVSASKGDVDLKSEDEKKAEEKQQKENKKKFKKLLETLEKLLESEIKEVRLSARLTSSAACLVSDENAMSSQMEKLMSSMGQEIPKHKRILEINPKHRITAILEKIFSENKTDSRLVRYARLLLDQAKLAEGLPLENPVDFAREVSELIVAAEEKQASPA
ncbi:MAG: molecular chaperone HtpG [Planctomycetes bacterium]|nr:molecular chaperone HtpG [Planctomycetota bacterium]